MKVFKEKHNNVLYFFYRMLEPVLDPVHFVRGIYGYFWYTKDLITFKMKKSNLPLHVRDLFPQLHDKTSFTPFDAQYFYQQIYVFDEIRKKNPSHHIDIASTYELSGYLSRIIKTTFVDIRPIQTSLKNLNIVNGDILSLPYKTNSVESLSCLHVVEHIGLGRYGDPIDPDGTEKACKELARVLKPGGVLYFSTPIGKERVCFNAHHIHTPDQILAFFSDLTLLKFSAVDDNGVFHESTEYKKYRKADYVCGIFIFTKNKKR